MIKIGAVWKYEKEETGTYFKGRIDLPVPILLNPGTSILLFKNRSDHEKAPALDVLIDEPQKKQNESKNVEADLEEF